MPEQHRHLANKYEDNVNLQGAEAYHGGRPPTACYMHTTDVVGYCSRLQLDVRNLSLGYAIW